MDLLSYELGKKAGGGGGGGSSSKPVWYDSKPIDWETENTSATINIANLIASYKPTEVRANQKGFVIIFVRSNYTVSDNITVIAETEFATDGSTNQKLILGWCDDFSENITVTQEEYARMGIYALRMQFCETPTANDIILNETTTLGSITTSSTSNMCIYFVTNIYFTSYSTISNLDDFYNNGNTMVAQRMNWFIRYQQGEVSIPLETSGSAIIGIEMKPSSIR